MERLGIASRDEADPETLTDRLLTEVVAGGATPHGPDVRCMVDRAIGLTPGPRRLTPAGSVLQQAPSGTPIAIPKLKGYLLANIGDPANALAQPE